MAFNIITGGPCSGKTTLIDLLKKDGHTVGEETARRIISEESKKPHGVLPWNDFSGFQKLVMQRQEMMEQTLPAHSFLDRSIIDVLAYHKSFMQVPPKNFLEKIARAVAEQRYANVFLLEPLPYQRDEERKEDHLTAQRIHKSIEEVYRFFDLTIIPVPDYTYPERRLNFVKDVLATKRPYASLGARLPDKLMNSFYLSSPIRKDGVR